MKKKATLIQILISCCSFVFLVQSTNARRPDHHKSDHSSYSSEILGKSNAWLNANRRADIYTSWRLPKQKRATQYRQKKNNVINGNLIPLRRQINVGVEPLHRRKNTNTKSDSIHGNLITKRSRNGQTTSEENNDLPSDFFGLSIQEPVLRFVDGKGPVGTATSEFVDPFSDLIEEPPLSQYAYKPRTQESEDSQTSFEGVKKPVASLQNHQRIGLPFGKISSEEQQHIKEALRVTDGDTETDQTKARILTYNRVSKKKQQEKAMNSSNPYAYLNLPTTQSVDIEPVKTKSDREEAKISSFTQNATENTAGHEGNEKHAPEDKSSEKSVEEDITPPSEDAETVSTNVVEVKEIEGNDNDTKAVDELTTIVSNALSDNSKSTGKADDSKSVEASFGKQQEENKHSLDEVSSSSTKDFSKEINDQKPPESTNTSPSNQYIDIKEPNLKFSISLNATENQTDKYIEKLENVIKLVKGMKSSATGKALNDNQITPTVKHEVENSSPSSLLDISTTSNESLVNMKDKEKSPPLLNIG